MRRVDHILNSVFSSLCLEERAHILKAICERCRVRCVLRDLRALLRSRGSDRQNKATSKQKLKRPSSVKCGKRCFAAMAVTEDNTGVYVVFQFKHRGHDFELGRVFLSKSERAAIADKLREGVSMDAVLDNVRSNVDETFHRINVLSKQDLRKIMRDARVSKTERLHDNDYVSMQLWVERMHSEKENPLLFFKHQGQPDKK
nr:uncharacterized protein LOC126538952 isoform X1 [Dermacentor andersoni]